MQKIITINFYKNRFKMTLKFCLRNISKKYTALLMLKMMISLLQPKGYHDIGKTAILGSFLELARTFPDPLWYFEIY